MPAGSYGNRSVLKGVADLAPGKEQWLAIDRAAVGRLFFFLTEATGNQTIFYPTGNLYQLLRLLSAGAQPPQPPQDPQVPTGDMVGLWDLLPQHLTDFSPFYLKGRTTCSSVPVPNAWQKLMTPM